jgi:hypothetical protein
VRKSSPLWYVVGFILPAQLSSPLYLLLTRQTSNVSGH